MSHSRAESEKDAHSDESAVELCRRAGHCLVLKPVVPMIGGYEQRRGIDVRPSTCRLLLKLPV